jgi:hypothetical protein
MIFCYILCCRFIIYKHSAHTNKQRKNNWPDKYTSSSVTVAIVSSRPALAPTHPAIQWALEIYLDLKRPERGTDRCSRWSIGYRACHWIKGSRVKTHPRAMYF